MAKTETRFPLLAEAVNKLAGEVQSFSADIAPYYLAELLVDGKITAITDEQHGLLESFADSIATEGPNFETSARNWRNAVAEVAKVPGAVIPATGQVAARVARSRASSRKR